MMSSGCGSSSGTGRIRQSFYARLAEPQVRSMNCSQYGSLGMNSHLDISSTPCSEIINYCFLLYEKEQILQRLGIDNTRLEGRSPTLQSEGKYGGKRDPALGCLQVFDVTLGHDMRLVGRY